MSKAFGTKFILINDVQQILDPRTFGGGPWLHLASVVRGFKEYMCFKHTPTDTIYIEELDASSPHLFKKIKDEAEFRDLEAFLKSLGILSIGTNMEYKVAKEKN